MKKARTARVLRYRMFRMAYHIRLREIAAEAGISVQRLNQLELMQQPCTPHTRALLLHGLEACLYRRCMDAGAALADYYAVRRNLFDAVCEVDYERTTYCISHPDELH